MNANKIHRHFCVPMSKNHRIRSLCFLDWTSILKQFEIVYLPLTLPTHQEYSFFREKVFLEVVKVHGTKENKRDFHCSLAYLAWDEQTEFRRWEVPTDTERSWRHQLWWYSVCTAWRPQEPSSGGSVCGKTSTGHLFTKRLVLPL